MKAISGGHGLRIAGQGGAGFFLDSVQLQGPDSTVIQGVDISILSPDRLVTYLVRPLSPSFARNLAHFLKESSIADPGIETGPFEDRPSGLLINIKTIDEMWAEIDIRVAEDLDSDVIEFDEINFETSRASLLVAAESLHDFS